MAYSMTFLARGVWGSLPRGREPPHPLSSVLQLGTGRVLTPDFRTAWRVRTRRAGTALGGDPHALTRLEVIGSRRGLRENPVAAGLDYSNCLTVFSFWR